MDLQLSFGYDAASWIACEWWRSLANWCVFIQFLLLVRWSINNDTVQWILVIERWWHNTINIITTINEVAHVTDMSKPFNWLWTMNDGEMVQINTTLLTCPFPVRGSCGCSTLFDHAIHVLVRYLWLYVENC